MKNESPNRERTILWLDINEHPPSYLVNPYTEGEDWYTNFLVLRDNKEVYLAHLRKDKGGIQYFYASKPQSHPIPIDRVTHWVWLIDDEGREAYMGKYL